MKQEKQILKKRKLVRKTEFKSLLIGIVIFPIIAMSLFHVYFPRHSTELLEHKKLYKPIIAERDITHKKLIDELEKGEILVSEYLRLDKVNTSNSKAKLKSYTKRKNEIIKNDMFLGRASFRYWIFFFGLVLPILYFSFKSLINDINRENKTGHKYISIGGIAVGFFWLYHLLFRTETDFNTQTYFYLILAISLLAGFFTHKLIKYFMKKYDREESLLRNIRNLVGFALRNTKDEKEEELWTVLEKVSNNE